MMEAVNSSTTLVDAYQTTKHPSPEHNVMANLLANYALENKVNNTQIMERLLDRMSMVWCTTMTVASKVKHLYTEW